MLFNVISGSRVDWKTQECPRYKIDQKLSITKFSIDSIFELDDMHFIS